MLDDRGQRDLGDHPRPGTRRRWAASLSMSAAAARPRARAAARAGARYCVVRYSQGSQTALVRT